MACYIATITYIIKQGQVIHKLNNPISVISAGPDDSGAQCQCGAAIYGRQRYISLDRYTHSEQNNVI